MNIRRSCWLKAAVIALPLAAAAPLLAQDDAQQQGTPEQSSPEEESGFLEGLIQDALGGEGRTVRVIGLQGALSSSARIERIEIADDDGTWLTVSDVRLDWLRRALILRRRLEVQALTIGAVDFVRPPLPGPAEPPALQAEADPEPFSLPSLPVAVQVDTLEVGRLDLGEALLGQAVQMTIAGSAQLAGGEGSVDLRVERTDATRGRFAVEAGFDNESRQLLVDVDVDEAAGGLIVSLADIPGEPPLTLSVAGDAPISDFTADLELATAGEPRLTGTVSLSEERGGDGQDGGGDGAAGVTRIVAADIQGDVAELFLPEYRDFFGRRVALDLRARQNPQAGLEVERLRLVSQALNLQGSLALDPEGWPRRIDLQGRIANELGLPVVLPVAGPAILVDNAALTVDYDATRDQGFLAQLAADGILREGGTLIDRLRLVADGTLERGEGTAPGRVLADIAARLQGFSSTDQGLSEAAGDLIALFATVDWRQNEVLRLSDLVLRSGDLSARGNVDVTGIDAGQPVAEGRLQIDADEIARFARLAGSPISGGLSAEAEGRFAAASGAFDVDLTGRGRDLSVGNREADLALAGDTRIRLAASRDTDGIEVEQVEVASPAVDLVGSASISPQGWPLRVRLDGDIGLQGGERLRLPVPGRAVRLGAARIDAAYDASEGDDFTLSIGAREISDAGFAALNRAQIDADGRLVRDAAGTGVERIVADLEAALTGFSAEDPGLARALGRALTLSAAMDWRLDGDMTLDRLRLVSGDARVTGSAVARGLTGGAISGSGDLAVETGDLARFAALAGQDLGGSASLEAEGRFDQADNGFALDLDLRGRDVAVGVAQADQLLVGDSRVLVTADGNQGRLNLETFDINSREVALTADGSITETSGSIEIDGRLRDVGILAPDFPGPLVLAGVVSRSGEVISVDTDLNGPGGTAAQVTGDAVRPDGEVDLDITGQAPLALANRVLAPRALDGVAEFDLALEGEPSLAALSGTITTQSARFVEPAQQLAVEGLDVTVRIADEVANLEAGGALSSGGQLSASGPVALTPPFDADLSLALTDATLVDPRLYQIDLGADLSIAGPLAGGALIGGRIDIDEAELRVPVGGAGTGVLLDVTHIGEPPLSRLSRQRAGLEIDPGEGDEGDGPSYGLDILISAPREVFLRGRGLDVELGGEIVIEGTTQNPIPQGVLSLRRGRFDVLRQRLIFDTATVTLQGDLNPELNLVASSTAGDVEAIITISGTPRRPDIELSSQPELPEDEVLAQLFFAKPVSELTPLELAQLAAAFNQLRGGSGGFLGRLRAGLGVDDLNVGTNEDGQASVSAGKYLTERVYSDVSVGADGTSEIELNYEFTPSLSAAGSFDNRGDTSVGFIFQRDY